MRRFVALCLAVATVLAGAAPSALAAGGSTLRTTTTPSLTRSFPLGSHRLHRSSPARHVSQSQSQTQPRSSPTTSARPAASVAPVSSTAWILIVLGAIGLTAVVTWYVQSRVMTRGSRRSDAVDETPSDQATPDGVPEPDAVKFLLYQDNSGGYYWTIVDDVGEVLARSAGFASYPEANYAADIVHRAAASATFENRSGTSPPPRPLARADGPAKADGAEPEAAPEGGSVSREEVTRQAKAVGSRRRAPRALREVAADESPALSPPRPGR